MNVGIKFSGVAKEASAIAVCSGIGAYALGLGHPGLGATLGGTAFLVNKVVGSVFDKFIQAPDISRRGSYYAVKITAYALAYSASKMIVVAATIALSSAVANGLGLTASAMVVNSLATAHNYSKIFECGYYAGLVKVFVSVVLTDMRRESHNNNSVEYGDGLAGPLDFGGYECQRVVPDPYPQSQDNSETSHLGRTRLFSETDVEQARVHNKHLQYRFAEVCVPDVELTEDRMKNLIVDKAREQVIEIPKYTLHLFGGVSPGTGMHVGPQYLVLNSVYKSMIKRIVHHLDTELEKSEREEAFGKVVELNDLWVKTLQHLEAGSGDCADPVGEQIQQMYNTLFSEEQVIVNDFEGKIHLECRKLRDELFREACAEVMEASPRHLDQATGYEFYKLQLRGPLSLSPSSGSFLPSYCNQGGYRAQIPQIRQAFARKYSAGRIITHMQGAERTGKQRFGFGDMRQWLVGKTGADGNEVAAAMLDVDLVTGDAGSEHPTRKIWATVLSNLTCPVIH
ncbi:MAG: hypothetical protein ACI9YB_002951 [Halioglobus sp.]|jgi:hypothetical protein